MYLQQRAPTAFGPDPILTAPMLKSPILKTLSWMLGMLRSHEEAAVPDNPATIKDLRLLYDVGQIDYRVTTPSHDDLARHEQWSWMHHYPR